MSGSKDVLSVVYTRTKYLTKYRFFQKLTNIYKFNHTKKLIEDLNVFRKDLSVRQEVSDEIQISISFITDELQNFIEVDISCKKTKVKSFQCNWDGKK